MEPTPLAERFRQREIDRKWTGKEVTGQIEALKRRIPTHGDKSTPFTKHLYDVLKEFITAVGDRALEIANEEQREQQMFLERQERQSKTIAEIAELERRLALLRRENDELTRENEEYSRLLLQGDNTPIPQRPREITQESLEPPRSRGQLASSDVDLFAGNPKKNN